jgi:hypothetical protein
MAKLLAKKTSSIRILTIRYQKVVLDADLAAIYGATTKRLNEQFRRNRKRFPKDFAFQLTTEEYETLRSQFAAPWKKTNTIDPTGRKMRPDHCRAAVCGHKL